MSSLNQSFPRRMRRRRWLYVLQWRKSSTQYAKPLQLVRALLRRSDMRKQRVPRGSRKDGLQQSSHRFAK